MTSLTESVRQELKAPNVAAPVKEKDMLLVEILNLRGSL